jgi:hypothetical protein
MLEDDDYPFECCPLCGAELGECEGDHDVEDDAGPAVAATP